MRLSMRYRTPAMATSNPPPVDQSVLPARTQPAKSPISQQLTNVCRARRTPMGTSLVSIAVTWLGRSYYDPTNVQRASAPFVGGAYVDPCARPGSARLFLISQHLKGLSRALAPLTGATAVLLGAWVAIARGAGDGRRFVLSAVVMAGGHSGRRAAGWPREVALVVREPPDGLLSRCSGASGRLPGGA